MARSILALPLNSSLSSCSAIPAVHTSPPPPGPGPPQNCYSSAKPRPACRSVAGGSSRAQTLRAHRSVPQLAAPPHAAASRPGALAAGVQDPCQRPCPLAARRVPPSHSPAPPRALVRHDAPPTPNARSRPRPQGPGLELPGHHAAEHRALQGPPIQVSPVAWRRQPAPPPPGAAPPSRCPVPCGLCPNTLIVLPCARCATYAHVFFRLAPSCPPPRGPKYAVDKYGVDVAILAHLANRKEYT